MDTLSPSPVAVVGGLVLMLLGSLITMHDIALQNQHATLGKITKVIEFAFLVALTGATANAVQNELIHVFGNNLWGFLVGGGISALLLVYGERIIDVVDRLLEPQRVELGRTLFLIGLITEALQLYVALAVCALLH